jgi:hypothetical protein
VTVRNWHEWFITPDDDPQAHEAADAVRVVAGAGHRDPDKPLHIRETIPPRCAKCKQFVGYDTGMHLMISGSWRIHISCFAEVLEQHWEDGEVIDLTNGSIRTFDYDDS